MAQDENYQSNDKTHKNKWKPIYHDWTTKCQSSKKFKLTINLEKLLDPSSSFPKSIKKKLSTNHMKTRQRKRTC